MNLMQTITNLKSDCLVTLRGMFIIWTYVPVRVVSANRMRKY